MKVGWRAKAAIQGVLSVVPGGDSLNYVLQSRVTHSLPVGESVLVENVETAQSHLRAVVEHLHLPLGEAAFYEFGAGWSLGVPIALAGLGVTNQTLVDIRALARPDLVGDIVRRLPPAGERVGTSLRLAPWPAESDLASALRAYGIAYMAPCDARSTGLESASIDVVTSTSTFEHIPKADIVPILSECRRILKPSGVMSAWIDYKDHYASFDDRIGPYNFLTFDQKAWRRYSPSLQYQNRLRHREYVDLFEEAGFEILQLEVIEADQRDLDALAGLDIDPSFSGFTPEELGVRDAHFVARPRATGSGPIR